MHPESDFYQISGHRAHSHIWFKKYDDKPLTVAIASEKSRLFRPWGQDSPIELILGILPSGASYLLMTSEQMLEFTRRHRLHIPRDPWRATNFVSLSPIHFNSLEELSAKVTTYKARPRNKNRREVEEPLDNSQANRGYVKTGNDVVHYRGYFEQQRTMYRLLTRDLEPGKVGLVSPPWLSSVRVVSLVFVEWTIDNRRRDDRLKDPKLVDVGWTDASFPSFFEQLTGSTVHLKLKSLAFKNPGSKNPHFSDIVEDDRAGLYARLQNLFSHDTNKSGIPLIVLVHDEQMAREVLSRAGIDVNSWSSGLSKLLSPVSVKNHRRTTSEDTSNTTVIPGPSVICMPRLVEALMETNPGHTVPHSAKVLRMQTNTSSCAGDDSLLQLRMWTSMAEGLAIDEQRTQRSTRTPDCAQVLAPPEQEEQEQEQNAGEEFDPNDGDVDPNDMAPGPRPTIADDFSSDDDW